MTPERAYWKAHGAGERSPEIEDIILTNSWCSYFYARDVIKGRWIEAEDIIMTESEDSYLYARDVIKGKLPEKMHNMMLLFAIKNPNSWYVRKYFEYIK